MRIGHFAPHIWAPGGIATYVQRLGTAQTERGYAVTYLSRDSASAPHDVHAVSVNDDADVIRQVRALQLDVLHLHKPLSTLPDSTVPMVRTIHGHQASCPSGSRYLARTGQPCNRTPSVAACLWGRVADRCGSVRPQHIWTEQNRFRHEVEMAHRMPTVAVSRFLRERMIDAGCPPDRLYAVPSPAPVVPSVAAMPREGTPRFLFLGRLVPHKGVLWLLRAVERVRSEGHAIHLDIAGDGDLAATAQRYVTRHGLGDAVTFHGWVEEERVSTLIQSARAIIFPSIWHEPAGLVSLEAAAHGRALIASRVGGIPEYGRDDYAVLVPPNDTSALANAIASLAQDPDRCENLGRRGRHLAQTMFSMDTFLDTMDDIYREVSTSTSHTALRPASPMPSSATSA